MNLETFFCAALATIAILWVTLSMLRATLIFRFRLRAINIAWETGVAHHITQKRVKVYRRATFDEMLSDWRKWTFKQFYPEFEGIHVSDQ